MNDRKPNHLLNEKSPYLQQHAYNPVEWHPWGPDALKAAKDQDKPIFLSIGYSTCHWCHVMEHESFENPDVAKVMNENFINIKVDREERPDLDALYMESVQMLTGQGGWPMSVWLTPDLVPFYGGTYFPPEGRFGRPGFTDLLTQLAQLWKTQRDRVHDAAQQIMDALKNATVSAVPGATGSPDLKAAVDIALRGLESIFDPMEGGFGPAPKFPMPAYLDFLMAHYARTGHKKSLEMVELTLTKMIKGGLYDQLGGGFARYSTDARWIVPHFEKMLYDNAQLIQSLARLFQLTRNPFYAQALHEPIEYIRRDLTHPDGGFYSAEDADSEGKEGLFYLWTLAEVKTILGEDAEIFIERYGLSINGNFMDPHTQELGKNILVQDKSVKEVVKKFGIEPKTGTDKLEAAKKRLFELRTRRVRPLRDEKILTGWNGLMISALAQAGAILDQPDYLARAERAARFLYQNLYDEAGNRLFRRWRDGERKYSGQQPDYAFLIQGLLDLFEATGTPDWLEWAVRLHDQHNALFWDPAQGGYFMTEPAPDLLIRLKDDRDNVIPSGNSVAVLNGLRLGHLTQNKEWTDKAERTLLAFALVLDRHPLALGKMLVAYDEQAQGPGQVVVVGQKSAADTQDLRRIYFEFPQPGRTLILADPQKTQERLVRTIPALKGMSSQAGRATAYICVNFSCQQPTTDSGRFRDHFLNQKAEE